MRRGMRTILARSRAGVLLGLSLSLTACSTLSGITDGLLGGNKPEAGQPGYIAGFLGGVAADEPRAAIAGREVLAAGGNAADAAVAVGFTLAVTLPSRAGLGGGGACLAYAADKKSVNAGVPEAVLFTPIAPASGAVGDRPAALPMMPRGLFLLHARYGSRPFETLVVTAEQLARFGVPASRAFVRDLNLVSGPLFADPGARAVFSRDGVPLKEGQQMVQPELGTTLALLRTAGVGDLYQGMLARRIEQSTPLADTQLLVSDLRGALPRLATPIVISDRDDKVAFLPPPADGGLGAAAVFAALQRNGSVDAAMARGLAAVARYRAGGVTPEAVMASADLPQADMPPLPASTSFATLDRDGNAVVCALTMDNLFGTGRLLPSLGFLPAASPASVPLPLLAAGLAWNENIKAFRAEAAGSGQSGAATAVAVGLLNALRTDQPMAKPVPEPGRANVITCGRYLPGNNGACGWATDPREAGLAAGGG